MNVRFALVFACAVAPTALAATPVKYATVDTHGGFTAWDQSTSVDIMVQQGSPVGGRVTVIRDLRTGTPLQMTGSLSLGRTASLYFAGRDARVGDYADSWTAFQNVDLPTVDVSVWGATQIIHQDEIAFPPNVPETTGDMSDFVADMNQTAQRVAEAPLFEYSAAGGMTGFQRRITVTQEGWVTDDSTDLFGVNDRHVSGWLDSDTIAHLKTLAFYAHWFQLAGWDGHPSWVDGIDEEATVCHYGDCHAVWGGYSWERTAEYQAFLEALVAAGDAL